MKLSYTAFLAALSYAATIAPASAISLGDLTGAASTATEGSSVIDAVAGDGAANIINGDVSPTVALASSQLGIPSKYQPQVQDLYDMYKGNGSISSADVEGQTGLSSWLSDSSSLDSSSVATGLSKVFAAAK